MGGVGGGMGSSLQVNIHFGSYFYVFSFLDPFLNFFHFVLWGLNSPLRSRVTCCTHWASLAVLGLFPGRGPGMCQLQAPPAWGHLPLHQRQDGVGTETGGCWGLRGQRQVRGRGRWGDAAGGGSGRCEAGFVPARAPRGPALGAVFRPARAAADFQAGLHPR